ncbi:carboxypeptidase-like regulatory domain-containing protein [Algoriphagus limi]|uniref:Carboxypeptidase-like regulatory domain-containing protein n=1 Tax=Algoriphagus limi TaxID=2975273 RepID=A0ABT2G0Y4_9BACT|nr:carboxypeptidase-like regulatory domain-containing protein [Algoriphagus limi]MCS5488921.1 carboxypeptidase-like regulatory domain-containing protein [Algoriphagus limi]
MLFLKRLLLLSFFAGIVIPAWGQGKALTGRVLDSLDRPIPYANIVAINQSTQKIGGFGISNDEGKFKITLNPGSEYLLRVSFVGYRQFEMSVTEWDSETPFLIVLEQADTELGMVEVVSELPVTMKGDTLTYKTDAFTTGNERKLEDVLEKLPGFQVDENGEVKVQGKKVDKVLVDGKTFFDGDTKLATKNLPANAVDRVQVLKNFNEVSPIRGLDNNETLALNIELKDGKKNMVFGDLEAGGGPKERYLGHANAFYYAPKLNLNLIGGSNNVGEQTFTLQDYFRFNGGLAGLSSRSGSRVQLNGDDIGIPLANRTNAAQLNTHLGALNFNYTPSRTWRHAGFLIGSASKNKLGSNSFRTYLNSGENVQETLASASEVENASALGKYSLTYTPKEETYIRYSAFGKISDISNTNLLQSNFGQTQQNLASINSRNPYAIQQKFEWYHAPSERHVFSTELNWERKFTDPIFDLTTNLKPILGLAIIPDAEQYRLIQSQELRTGTLEGAFNYYYILNPTNHLNWSLGYQQFKQKLEGELNQDGSDEEFQAFDNENEFGFQDLYVGMTWKTKWKKFIISPSIFAHRYTWQDQQFENELSYRKILALPGLYAKWNIKSNRSLTYRYQVEANFMDIQKLAQGLVLQDYNAVFQGNRTLDNGLFSNHNLSYNHFDMFSGLTVFGNMNYQRKRDEIVTSTDFAGINRLLSLQNIEPVNETLNGDIRLDKALNKFKFEVGGNWNAFSTNLLLDDLPAQNKQFSQTYDTKLTTTFFKVLEVDFAYSFTTNRYNSGNLENTFTTHSPRIEIDLDIFKGLRLNADYTYNTYLNRAAGTQSDFDFLNAFLTYRGKSSPWEIKVSVWNLLDTRSIRRDSFNENLISTFSYLVQPRYGLLTLKYDL